VRNEDHMRGVGMFAKRALLWACTHKQESRTGRSLYTRPCVEDGQQVLLTGKPPTERSNLYIERNAELLSRNVARVLPRRMKSFEIDTEWNMRNARHAFCCQFIGKKLRGDNGDVEQSVELSRVP